MEYRSREGMGQEARGGISEASEKSIFGDIEDTGDFVGDIQSHGWLLSVLRQYN